ncbi:Presenilins-associated rhomboid-like protein, mitochondrial [Toxocara canis]|uniref:rhomboid protease n=1 Tax=Toxocara canis TaxID=6265 RepID=A0A0B2V9D6_TOXCA|nr:Presenilins-associated rhomboid-like protein, mitochondrial [Toxocara canis]
MLSRLVCCGGRQLCLSSRWPNLGQLRLSRFDRAELRSRLHREPKVKHTNVSVPYHADLIPIRPPRHLWKAFAFTLTVCGASFTVASITDWERAKKRMRRFWNDSVEFFGVSPQQQQRFADEWWVRMSDGQKTSFYILAANVAVFFLWKVKAFEPFMWRWFTNSYASKALCLPMVLSAFSHSHWLHLGLNMYVLYSFAGISIDRFLGLDQFMAFYLTAASVSSLTSLAHKCAIGSSVRALGASGAILAVLAYTCTRVPDARLQIVFIPALNFSAQSAVIGLVIFDLAGLVLRFRLFDHAAHLGGTLFGIYDVPSLSTLITI